jgi:uncharacterized protein with ParB-like and HNH nuclease domain
MSSVSNKIEAKDYSIRDVLDNKKFTIDYFQREYKWRQKHMEQLIADLEASFYNDYSEEHPREEVANYNSYYLGPIVVSNKDGKKSIIDGQQRLTSITLLLIYLNNLQKDAPDPVELNTLIYSKVYGKKSFNLDVPERQHCLEALFNEGYYELQDEDDESVKNIVDRYADISTYFPDALKDHALPYFLDWLINNVVMVVITAYSDENAYTIFETMNDRGLHLTNAEMLKGYLLSKLSKSDRDTLDVLWRKEIKGLHEYGDDEDQKFFQAWLRAKYAESIRPGKIGAANEDFEKIGTRFHTWVKDNHSKLGLIKSKDFHFFIHSSMAFYVKVYRKIYDAAEELIPGLEHLFYGGYEGPRFAASLADPLLLAPILPEDKEEVVNKKLNLVARFIETFCVYRAANYRNFSQSSIRYTMYNLVLEIRNKDVRALSQILKKRLEEQTENLSGMSNLKLHGQNKWFIKYILSRITGHIEQMSGKENRFDEYYFRSVGQSFEIEHIWANKMEYHEDEISQSDEFREMRNSIGDLILLPKGTNQSFSDAPYEEKLPHYLKENLLAQSLHPACYEKNPNFRHYVESADHPFRPHEQYKVADLKERQVLYQSIAEEIWSLGFFDTNAEHP